MLISSDSHVVEPGDLWLERLPKHLRDRAPRAVQDPENHYWYFEAPEMGRGVNLTLSRNAGISTQEVDAALAADPDAWVGATGGHDPVTRLADMWVDDTVADVVYPTAGLSLLQYDDVELQLACIQVYNDWLAEFCAVDSDRIIGIAMIPTWDIDVGVAELNRCGDMGLRGAIIWSSPPATREYSFFSNRYEPLWATAAERSMPVSIHIFGGHQTKGISNYGVTVEGTYYFGITARDELAHTTAELIAAGVFERHPNLRIVAAEGGIDYAARLEQRLDLTYSGAWSRIDDTLTMKPSEYFRRNVYLTYIEDPIGLNNLRFTGSDHFMWSSDYPHGAATWPRSREFTANEFNEAGVSEADRRKLTLTNVAELYSIDLETVSQPSPVIADQVAMAPAAN
ncbi:amidohydrolase family protein [Candidatus Poriferisocius sp.]|uniref:amidohydrolase family protein n=1 Tax=Candidatus Poriferisocius sp. TaxID=3101276 RepID=UPI003B58C61E